MKEIIIKALITVSKVAVIYVAIMSTILAGVIGMAMPEMGFGILVASGLLLIAFEILCKGGRPNDSGNET